MRAGPATLAPDAPCAPWCAVPDPDESGAESGAAFLDAHPEWCCRKIDLEDPALRARAVWASRVASSFLFRRTGFRYNGGCTVEEYLCLGVNDAGCWALGWGDSWRSSPAPSGDGETWLNHSCGCGASCDCGQGRRVLLPYGPVVEVVSLTIGDALVPEANYRVVGDYLYLCDDAPDADVCFDACASTGLLVQWTFGEAPPADGLNAACVLTCELYKACSGEECRLPKRIISASRQGFTYNKIDPMDFLNDGLTGLYEVDLFLSTVPSAPSATVTFPEDVAPLDFDSRARPRW